MIVMKFGGTSTKDADAMLNVTSIVKSHLSQKPIIVISAIAQATNMLESIANLARDGNRKKANEVLNDFITRHKSIVEKAINNTTKAAELNRIIEDFEEQIEELVNGVAILKELTAKSLDRFYAFGELMSSLIICEIMKENGINSIWLDTKDFMITDSNFNRAQPIMNSVKEKLIPIISNLMQDNQIPVTQGFIGVTISGDRTTMGRESSDYSASVIGAVLNVHNIQIWTDVDGVLTGDPNVVTNPKKIKNLSFEEAYQLSFFGAKVLHPNTMIPAQEKNIPIYVYNSKRPNSKGTLVTDTSNLEFTDLPVIKSITYKPGISLLTILPNQRFSPYIFWEHIFSILNKYKISPLTCSTLEYVFSTAFETKFLNDSVLNELETIGKIELRNGLALISLIGQNLNKDFTILPKVLSHLESVKIYFSNYGASNYCFSLIVDEKEMFQVVNELHKIFFETQTNPYFFENIE